MERTHQHQEAFAARRCTSMWNERARFKDGQPHPGVEGRMIHP